MLSDHEVRQQSPSYSSPGVESHPRRRNIGDFLSNPDLQKRLGVDPAASGNFSHHAPSVNLAFRQHLDHWGFPAQYYISALLERGVRALIYVGATDYICNWVRTSPPEP